MRVATAIDVHAFSRQPRPLMLACLEFSDTGGLAGHSDADVAAHAAADALLIASGIGELGTVFGTDREEWAGASGSVLLGEAVRLVSEAGWQIENVDPNTLAKNPVLLRAGLRRKKPCRASSEHPYFFPQQRRTTWGHWDALRVSLPWRRLF